MSVVSIMAFVPLPAATVNLSCTTTTGRVLVSTPGNTSPQSWRLYNIGTDTVFFELGDVTVTAALATGVPLAPGDCILVTGFKGTNYVAGICPTGTATLYITPGAGS